MVVIVCYSKGDASYSEAVQSIPGIFAEVLSILGGMDEDSGGGMDSEGRGELVGKASRRGNFAQDRGSGSNRRYGIRASRRTLRLSSTNAQM